MTGGAVINADDVTRMWQYLAGIRIALGNTLTVNPMIMQAPDIGGPLSVVVWVPFGQTWSIQGVSPGLTVHPAGANAFMINAGPNITTTTKTGAVVVVSGQVTRTVLVTQPPLPRVSITWHPNGGTVNPLSSNIASRVAFNNFLSIPPTPTRTGYRFDGWFTQQTGGNPIPDIVPSSNAAYWARWSSTTVTGVVVSPNTASLSVGDRIQLSATVMPSAANQNVTWTVSSSTASAEVSPSGWVTGLAPGVATVTATSTETGAAYASVIIYVSRPPRAFGQNKTLWCWAAAAKMVGEHNGGSGALNTGAVVLTNTDNLQSFQGVPLYGRNSSLQATADAGQRQIVMAAYGDDGNHSGNGERIENAMKLASLNPLSAWTRGTIDGSPISQADINHMNAQLALGRYVVASLRADLMPMNHAIVIQSFNPATNEYTYHDPRTDGLHTFTTADLLNGAIHLANNTGSTPHTLRYYCYTF